jgi:chromosomal replication initiation ATPase DnaA
LLELVLKLESDLSAILDVVTEIYSVTPAILQSSRRDAHIAHVRAVTALLAREASGTNLAEVARFFGQDPSAVSKAALRLERKLQASPDLRREIETLSQTLLPPV